MKTMMNNVTSTIFKKTTCVLGMLSLLATLTGGEARADRSAGNGLVILSQGTWTQVASACTPDEGSIDYQMNGAGVSFPSSVTGEITLRCNITNVMDSDFPWNTLEVVYRDPDGSGTTNRVRVALHKVSLNGAAESTTTVFNSAGQPTGIIDLSLLSTFDSNTVSSATSSTQVHTVGINHNFDFATNAYYVKITLKRDAGSTTNPAAFIIRLNGHLLIGG